MHIRIAHLNIPGIFRTSTHSYNKIAMQAATQTRYGSAEVLHVQEVETPSVGPKQVLVRVHASPVTDGDRRLREADFPGATALFGRAMFGLFRPRNPVPGTMFAGRVVAVGESATRFAVGDDVFGSCDSGAQAEFVAVSEEGALAKIPDGVDYDEAAAVPYGAATALAFLRDVVHVQPGEKVLIVGASGGVGRFAIQVARHLGAHVTGVGHARNAGMMTELGADAVIDYQREDYTKRTESYDVIFDTTSASGFRAAKPRLTHNGRYASVYVSLLIVWQMLWGAVRGGPKATASIVLGDRGLSEDVASLLAKGVLRPVIAARYPLSEVARAHAAQQAGGLSGTVVVTVRNSTRDAAAPQVLEVA